jgi:hypothetical protein
MLEDVVSVKFLSKHTRYTPSWGRSCFAFKNSCIDWMQRVNTYISYNHCCTTFSYWICLTPRIPEKETFWKQLSIVSTGNFLTFVRTLGSRLITYSIDLFMKRNITMELLNFWRFLGGNLTTYNTIYYSEHHDMRLDETSTYFVDP